MSRWPSFKAKKVYKALLRIGWTESHTAKGGSHRQMMRDGFSDVTWSFHENDEIGPKMLARLAKQTGLTPEDL